MTTALVIALTIAVAVMAVVYLPRYMLKRAVRQVVALFRKSGATSSRKATTLEELGLVPRGFMDRMFRVRDYKPYAVRLLSQANVLRTNRAGKVYLSEEELESSPVKQWAGLK